MNAFPRHALCPLQHCQYLNYAAIPLWVCHFLLRSHHQMPRFLCRQHHQRQTQTQRQLPNLPQLIQINPMYLLTIEQRWSCPTRPIYSSVRSSNCIESSSDSWVQRMPCVSRSFQFNSQSSFPLRLSSAYQGYSFRAVNQGEPTLDEMPIPFAAVWATGGHKRLGVA